VSDDLKLSYCAVLLMSWTKTCPSTAQIQGNQSLSIISMRTVRLVCTPQSRLCSLFHRPFLVVTRTCLPGRNSGARMPLSSVSHPPPSVVSCVFLPYTPSAVLPRRYKAIAVLTTQRCRLCLLQTLTSGCYPHLPCFGERDPQQAAPAGGGILPAFFTCCAVGSSFLT